MTNLVTIFGGSGFVGRYVAQRMARQGWRVRVAVRRPNEALFVKPYGVVGQVEPVLCNIRDDESVRSALRGASAAVNCVGILNEVGANTFQEVHVEGANRIARLAADLGVEKVVHVSALGADKDAPSAYARSKADGESAVLENFPQAVILRPSVIFGPEDRFFNRFAAMARRFPIVPIAGAGTRMQPVYVDDVAHAIERATTTNTGSSVYELGGPDIDTLRGLLGRMQSVIHRKRIVANLPFWVAGILALGLDMVQAVSLGLIPNSVLTRDQLKSLRTDNVVSDGASGFADLGIAPTAMDAVLPEYLWRFRPSGQYDAIKESARNLRT